MNPVIALVGRPNVGKSTLFNRLTRTRDALVADLPGLTRDRKYGEGRVGGIPYLLIDTGGISGDEQGIDALMAGQSLLAIQEADAVLFLVDARAGMTAADEMIAQHLRQQGKQAWVLVNKTDGLDADTYSAEFYALGLGEPVAIAAAHGRGVTQMIQNVLLDLRPEAMAEVLAQAQAESLYTSKRKAQALAEQAQPEMDAAADPFKRELNLDEEQIRISVVGRPNVGKSTLINRILGEERVVVFDQPGTTRDAIEIPYERDERKYLLVDTAGIRRRKYVSEVAEKFSIIKTLQAVRDSHVSVMVIDARVGLVEQDLHLLDFILESGRALVIAVNKWDGMTPEARQELKQDIERRLGFVEYADIHFISALHGTNVGHLYASIDQAFRSAFSRWSTNRLTRLLEDVVQEHQPPLVKGRRIKLRYAHQGGLNPPLIVVHGNQTQVLADSYKRYLMNTFRKILKIKGTPLRFEFRSGDNPFDPQVKDSRDAAKKRQLKRTAEARAERRARRK
ncbi:GTP-binding protein [Allopseudospirillum japonicum]|uniref:GTPase Der n=1 Tax=Allopseudospirillum japonicum TaxID=64971 RepID=A0A1H6S0R2_9GAMM|nr:ribosome biogenesis GTPase Der [Allopseudospirillum japonicum]SEI57620.1 GTP-binding protein [Allopseudospirillum japonicum]